MTKRVVVSGASGFIGRWSVPPLIAAGYEVHALTHTAGRPIPLQLQGAEVHRADLFDPAATSTLMRALRPTHLLHFAWIATPGLYWNSRDNFGWLAGSRYLLQTFRECGGGRAVVAGSCAEYDWPQAGVCHERTTPLADSADEAVTAYAKCKLALHRELESSGSAHGMSTAWGRIFFQYGPDEHPDRLVASVIGNLILGREAMCSHGRQIRSFLHVADVGAAFAALLDSSVEGPVNIGSADRVSLAELLDRIARQIGRPELLQLGARSSPSEPALLVPDVERLRNEVGWLPRFTLTDGIADTIEWWRARLQGDDGSARRQ